MLHSDISSKFNWEKEERLINGSKSIEDSLTSGKTDSDYKKIQVKFGKKVVFSENGLLRWETTCHY